MVVGDGVPPRGRAGRGAAAAVPAERERRGVGVAGVGGAAAARPLAAGRDYSVGAPDGAGRASITLTAPFLESVLRGGAPGVAANLTVRFSRGAASRVQVVQWERPRFGGPAASKAKPGSDLAIPIRWGGVQKVAGVKAVFADGEYLADDWTKWLGPLQAGYAVSSSDGLVVREGELMSADV